MAFLGVTLLRVTLLSGLGMTLLCHGMLAGRLLPGWLALGRARSLLLGPLGSPLGLLLSVGLLLPKAGRQFRRVALGLLGTDVVELVVAAEVGRARRRGRR